MPDSVAAVELIGATKRYGDQVAVDDLNLRIEPGEFFCLLGPSGCGKTTTLNLIGGFIPLTSGELCIEGRRVNDLPAQKRNVTTVFQNYALFPHMTVNENVAFGLQMDNLKREIVDGRVRDYLALVGLQQLGRRYPQQLSGGQAQRVALARALVKEPAVLLLDEPLGALDLKLRKQMQVELARIHRQVRTTFVFVTHDQEEALSLATQIAVMRDGRIVQLGTPREVYGRPNSRYVAEFVGESNFATMDGASLMIRPENIHFGPSGPPDGAHFTRGRVVGVSFLGSFTRTTFETSMGPIVAVNSNATGGSPVSSNLINQEVFVWWNSTDAVQISSD